MEEKQGTPKVDAGAASAQIEQLTNAAEHASQRARAAEESFKKTKDDVLTMFGTSISSGQARTLVMLLDTCFTYGQIHGESSENVMQNREQATMLARMLKDIRERDERSEKREDEIRVRDEKMMRLTERQVTALEALTGVKKKAAPASPASKKR